MRFVLDASVTINWAMSDEENPSADRALRELASGSAIVPGIWWYEVRNILVVNERRQRIAPSHSVRFLRELDEFDIDVDGQADSSTVLELARKYGTTVYDAAYLALALRERIPLATLDRALRAAATSAGVPLLT